MRETRWVVFVLTAYTRSQCGEPVWFHSKSEALAYAGDFNRSQRDSTWNAPIAYVEPVN